MTNKTPKPSRRQNPSRRCKKLSTPICKPRPRSFFDSLPFDAVENVVRFTSLKPHRRDWPSFVSSSDAASLLTTGGALTSCSQPHFTRLDVCGACPSRPRGVLLVAGGYSRRHHFARVLAALGPTLTDLRISRDSFPATWVAPLAAHCTALRRLSLSMRHMRNKFPLPDILAPLSGRLHALEIAWIVVQLSDVAAVAKHCEGLRVLSITARNVRADLTPVWTTVGKSLVELRIRGMDGPHSITGPDFQRIGLKKVGNLCRRLERITVECLPHMFQGEFANLVVSYGAQLRHVEVNWSRMLPDYILQIREMCPNAEFDLKEGCGPTADALVALGDHATRVNVGCDTVRAWGDAAMQNLVRVSESCQNLIAITVWCENVPHFAFDGLFRFPKSRLREFRAKYVKQPLAEQILATLAEKATQLEVFEFTGMLPPMTSLRKFAQSCAKLAEVSLNDVANPGMCSCQAGKARGRRDALVEKDANFGIAVGIFVKCKTVRQLVFSCTRAEQRAKPQPVPLFENACCPARMKNVSVTICGWHYV